MQFRWSLIVYWTICFVFGLAEHFNFAFYQYLLREYSFSHAFLLNLLMHSNSTAHPSLVMVGLLWRWVQSIALW